MIKSNKLFAAIACLTVAGTLTACSTAAGEKTTEATEASDVKTTVQYIAVDNKANTQSSVKTSFTQTVGEYDGVLYIGHSGNLPGDSRWYSTDASILSITESNRASAWKEGVVEISNGTDTKKVLCTTYNDNKEFDYCDYTDEAMMEWCTYDNCAEYIAEKINTVRDLQKFVIGAGYEYKDLCINVSHNWSWAASPQNVVDSRGGICQDLASFAVYVLQNDYEDVGVISVSGHGVGYAYNYVYENGKYLIFDISQLLCGWNIDESDWLIVDDIAQAQEEALNKVPKDYTLCILAISADNNPDITPTYLSYMQDDSQALNGDAVIGFEKGTKYQTIYAKTTVNFSIEEMDVFPGVRHYN